MKARIPVSNKLSNKQRKIALEATKEYIAQTQKDTMRRYMKLTSVILNQDFEFGKSRINKFLDRIIELSDDKEQDEEFWYHIDKIVIDQVGVPFERESYPDIFKD